MALAIVAPAHAQPKPAAKPAAAQPAKPAGAKPAAAPKADPKAAAPKAAAPKAAAPKADPKAAPPPKADPKAAAPKVDKTACALEPKKNLSEAKKKDEAKKAFGEGKTRFDKSDYEGALNCFKLAEAYIPGAQPKFRVAASLDKLGKISEAVAAYEAFLASVGPTPDEKFKEIVAESTTRVEALKKTPSKVKITMTPADAPNAKVALDGVPQAGMELTVPPGKHTITVTADGYDTATQPIEVSFNDTREAVVTLAKTPEPVATVAPVVTAAPTVVAVAPTATVAPVEAAPKSNVPAYVTLGLAGAGAIVGGIFGGMALASKSDFDKNPTVEKADETDRNALIADMSFAVALTFGVTGAVLLLSDTAAPAAPAKTGLAQKPAKKSAIRGFIAPYASPTGGGAAARFTF